MPKQTKTEELVEATDKTIGLWLEMRSMFRKTAQGGEIQAEDEQNFLELKSQVARLQRFIGQRLPENYKFGSSRMSDLMGQVVSLQTLQEMPEPDMNKLYNEWHESYIMLQQMRGVIDVMLEGFPVTFEGARRSSGNIKQDMQGEFKKSKPKVQAFMKNLGIACVAIAAIGGALYYLRYKGII